MSVSFLKSEVTSYTYLSKNDAEWIQFTVKLQRKAKTLTVEKLDLSVNLFLNMLVPADKKKILNLFKSLF